MTFMIQMVIFKLIMKRNIGIFGVRHGRNWEQGGGYANVKSEIGFSM
jgi:hypothetical protein